MRARQIHFIHVGKCGGESVGDAFDQHNIVRRDYHCGGSNREIAGQVLARNDDDYFVILVRDPISRFISAFEWDLWEKIISPPTPYDLEKWTRVYDTFPSANRLAEALTSHDDDLRQAAERAMRESDLHIHMDLGWYLPPRVAAHLHDGNAFAIRTEHINDDFSLLLQNLGIPKKPGFTVPFSKNNYKSNLPEHRRTGALSEIAEQNIRRFCESSFETLRILEDSGVVAGRAIESA